VVCTKRNTTQAHRHAHLDTKAEVKKRELDMEKMHRTQFTPNDRGERKRGK